MPRITIYTVSNIEYDTENGDYARDENGNYGTMEEEIHEVKDSAEAIQILSNSGCNQYSAYPDWQASGWYSAETYKDPYTGKGTEVSADLKGFTEEDSRAIHAAICH